MKQTKYRALDPVEELAVKTFAKDHGPEWKQKLSNAWALASMRLDRYTGLYGLRNSHGPAWLADYKLEKNDEQGS